MVRCVPDQGVPCAMPLLVVDDLQAVQVKTGHAQPMGRACTVGGEHLIEFIPVVQSGQGVLVAQPPENFGLFLNLRLLCGDLFLKILDGLLGHFGREAYFLLRHLPVGVGDMDMAAAGAVVCPAEDGGDALMNPKADLGGGIGGDPHPAAAEVGLRGDLDDMVDFFGDITLGHQSYKLPENAGYGLSADGKLVLSRAQPDDVLRHLIDDGIYIVFAIVLMYHKAVQLHDRLFSSFHFLQVKNHYAYSFPELIIPEKIIA